MKSDIQSRPNTIALSRNDKIVYPKESPVQISNKLRNSDEACLPFCFKIMLKGDLIVKIIKFISMSSGLAYVVCKLPIIAHCILPLHDGFFIARSGLTR